MNGKTIKQRLARRDALASKAREITRRLPADGPMFASQHGKVSWLDWLGHEKHRLAEQGIATAISENRDGFALVRVK